MLPDAESKGVDQSKTDVSPSAQSPGRPDKPLGRGLEDVSHLFLSQRRNEAAGSEHASGRSSERASPAPGPRAGTVLLRPWTTASFTRDQLAAALSELTGALEEGLRGIDARIPCDPCGEIDLLALDRANQLAIVDFDTTPNDGLLVRGMAHFDWAVRNTLNVRRMYPGPVINFSLQPRLFLVAPQFSPRLRSAARQIARPQITCVRYHVVDVSGGPGILFERVAGE
jgi:hypothetical protein